MVPKACQQLPEHPRVSRERLSSKFIPQNFRMNALRKEAQLAICPPTHNLMDVPDEVRSNHNYISCYQLANILSKIKFST